jgi:Flp pilus assembly protein TadG
MSHSLHHLAREERGAVLVFFALFAPVAVLFLSFVIDVGNWFDHARHLQLQADAGALAAAQGFQPCSDTAIYSAAGQYSGAASVTSPTGGSAPAGSPLYNLQTGGTPQANMHELVNSPTYYNQPSPVDGTVNATSPCAAEMVDVKLTETDLPWYFRLLRVPYINAHARVRILERTNATGSLPVAVNDLRPKAVEAYFVDESVSPAKQLATCGSGASLCSVELKSDGTSGSLSVWDNLGTPYGFAVRNPDVGVRIAVSGRSSLTGNMSTDCAQTFVTCSDASSAAVGLLHIQGWSGSGTGSATSPIVREVTLPQGTCSDGYFSNPAASCEIGVNAVVDFGASTPPEGAEVNAVVGGTSLTLAYNAETKRWTTSAAPVNPGAGAIQVDLKVTDKAMGGKKGTKTFSALQRSYTASSNSEPVQEAFLGREGGLIRDEDSFRMCESGNEGEKCTPKLVVRLGLKGSLGDAQSVSDPIYTMRFTGTGSQNQSVKCQAVNGGETYAATLASGCAGEWAINPTLTCPDKPSDCVVPATGNKENQVARGMNLRILGSEKPETCTSPNHWKEFTFTNGVPNVSASDPRVVTAFVTPYGSFGTSGASSEFPIAEFATFYVTGWQDKGEGFSNPCQGKGDDPAEAGTIVGHFIKYVETLAPSGSGGSVCELSSLNECIAVLTN